MNSVGRSLSVILCLFISFCANAESGPFTSLTLDPSVPRYDLTNYVSYVEDRNHLLSIKDFAESDQSHLQWARTRGVPNFGYSKSAYWFRFQMNGLRQSADDYLIEVDYSLIDSVDVFYIVDSKLISSYKTGDTFSFSGRPIFHRNFLFPLPDIESDRMEVYVRIESEGTLELPITLWKTDSFWGKEQPILIVKGGYYGVIMIMVIYNLFIYMSVRESSYLYYVCYALSLVIFQLSIDGIAYQFIWPGNAAWNGVSLILFGAITLNFLCLFSNSFLKLSGTNSLPSKALILGSVVMVMCAIASLMMPYRIAIQLLVGLSLPISIGCFAIGIYMLIKGVTIARYFIVAWSAFLCGVVAIALSKIGLLPINFITTNALQIGSAMEVVLFSLALADRINSDKKEKLFATQDAINNLKQFKSLYDNAIEGIFQCDLEGKFLSANNAMASFMGYSSPEEFMNNVESGEHQIFMDMEHFHEFRREVLEKHQVLNYEVQGYRKDGAPFWCSLSAKLVGTDSIEGFVVDVTDRKHSEEQLTFLARHDPLTGLVNRREFEIRLERGVITARKESGYHALLYMDLDQFKLVNDTCGHIAGDELLRQVTIQLQEHMRSVDTLARLGGDEFGVLLENCSREDATNVAHKLRQLIQDFRFAWDNKIFTLGVSIGLVIIDDKTESVKSLLSLADAACYAAKDAGRNRVHEYTPEDWELASKQREMQWASRITRALEENQLVLYRQEIAPVNSEDEEREREGVHYEILVRLMDGEDEVYPGAFIPAAERYNLMPALDRWVLSNVFKWLDNDRAKMESLSGCSINLSGLTLSDDEFPAFLRGLFEQYPLPPEKVCFEITETVAVTNLTQTIEFINEFKKLGCKFSLDDFGSGFSSYGYLKNLPVDYLKIDGAFVKDICDDPIDYAMVESINRIGHVMGKKTIAEFVESEEILAKLKEIGVDYGQGYWITRPERIDV